MSLQAVILDFDGVIADTEKLHLRAFQQVLAKRGVELRAEDYYDRYLGLDDAGVLLAVARHCGLVIGGDRLLPLLREKAACYAELISGTRVLFEGIAQCIREWSARVPLAIASGSQRSEIELILARDYLRGCFTAIVAAEDVPRGKPAPDPYLAALERLNAAHPVEARDVVVIEDSLPGIEAAKAAGMRVVAVTTSHPAQALSSADLVVPSLAALDLPTLSRL